MQTNPTSTNFKRLPAPSPATMKFVFKRLMPLLILNLRRGFS